MTVIPYTTVRQNFKSTMQQVCDDRAPIIVTRSGGDPVVMMALEEYDSLLETLHLLSSPKNAARLLKSIENAEKGNVIIHDLIEV